MKASHPNQINKMNHKKTNDSFDLHAYTNLSRKGKQYTTLIHEMRV